MFTGKYRIHILFILLLVISLVLYTGTFLFNERNKLSHSSQEDPNGTSNVNIEKEKPFPVIHRNFRKDISGNPQEINILEIDLSDERVEVLPALSHNSVFGFEALSSIASRTDAYAAVNGGFFHEYGQPSGMTAIDGETITKSSGKYPVLIFEGGKARLEQVVDRLWIQHDGRRIDINDINREGAPGRIVLYTPAYGSSSRAEMENITVAVSGDRVVKVAGYKGEAGIPQDGALIVFYQPVDYDMAGFPLKEGEKLEIRHEPAFDKPGTHAYECGSWVVKDGKVVIGDTDEWVGVMNNRDPRTVAGLKDENTLILMTVDGRQPGFSAGLTGKELGKLLLELGIRDAAMLDGGASTEMIVEGRIVNRPSFKGRERPLGGALVVRVTR